MKRLPLILYLLCFSFSVIAQDQYTENVPQPVRDKLDSLYPGAKDAWWYTSALYPDNFDVFFIRDTDRIMVSLWLEQNNQVNITLHYLDKGASSVPKMVKSKFDSLFPKAMHVWWCSKGCPVDSDDLRTEFSLGKSGSYLDNRSWVEFTTNGAITDMEVHVIDSSIPKNLMEYIHTRFANYDMQSYDSVEIIFDDKKNTPVYVAFLLRRKKSLRERLAHKYQETYLYFDLKGNYIRKHSHMWEYNSGCRF